MEKGPESGEANESASVGKAINADFCPQCAEVRVVRGSRALVTDRDHTKLGPLRNIPGVCTHSCLRSRARIFREALWRHSSRYYRRSYDGERLSSSPA